MTADRSVRSLSSLGGASSSRVLNLTAIARAQAHNPQHRAVPLFESPALNSAILLKHRLRANEVDSFLARRALATKIIIPFDRNNLRMGGQSIFVGQYGYEARLREVGHYKSEADAKHDIEVLRLIDAIPSLDPFLLREHLRQHGFTPDACYFSISPADQQRMYDYTAMEVRRLTALATGGQNTGDGGASNRMVIALLSSEVNEKLEPLRITLNLKPEEFSEGVFSWRGFIYYKWSLEQFWPSLISALKALKAIRPITKLTPDEQTFLASTKNTIIRAVKDHSDSVRRILKVYDGAYAGLTERHDPNVFREFLLGAPKLFLEMGEKMGAMSHVASFWQYRFPDEYSKRIDAEELVAIFEDFAKSFGVATEDAVAAPIVITRSA